MVLFWTTKLLVLHLWNGSNSEVEQSLYLLQGTTLFSACYIPCSLYYQIGASCQWQFFQALLFYSSELLVPSILCSVSSCVKVFISSPVQLNRFSKWIQQTQMTNLPLLCLVFLFSISNYLGNYFSHFYCLIISIPTDLEILNLSFLALINAVCIVHLYIWVLGLPLCTVQFFWWQPYSNPFVCHV